MLDKKRVVAERAPVATAAEVRAAPGVATDVGTAIRGAWVAVTAGPVISAAT